MTCPDISVFAYGLAAAWFDSTNLILVAGLFRLGDAPKSDAPSFWRRRQ